MTLGKHSNAPAEYAMKEEEEEEEEDDDDDDDDDESLTCHKHVHIHSAINRIYWRAAGR